MSNKLIRCLCACIALVAVMLFCTSCTAIEKKIYPLQYEEHIKESCDLYGVPYDLLAALIKTESGYDANARSSAGAVGLMQLLPSTAEELAGRMEVEYDENMLTDPKTNISYGCYYLAYLYNNLGNDWDTACAAYNAGIGRVTGWLENSEYSDDGKTLKYIPIEETRNYVNKINNYRIKYKELYFSTEGE